jgi:hypothetical protein
MHNRYYDNRFHSGKLLSIQDMADKYAAIVKKWKETECSLLEGDDDILNNILEFEHAWYYANEFGGYILCSDSDYEGDAIEEFGDAFLTLDYKGLIHDPEEIPEDEWENYYPYNGGELYINMPVVLEQIY